MKIKITIIGLILTVAAFFGLKMHKSESIAATPNIKNIAPAEEKSKSEEQQRQPQSWQFDQFS